MSIWKAQAGSWAEDRLKAGGNKPAREGTGRSVGLGLISGAGDGKYASDECARMDYDSPDFAALVGLVPTWL